MKKFLLAFFLCFLFAVSAAAEEPYTVSSCSEKITVAQDGSYRTEMTLTLAFQSAVTSFSVPLEDDVTAAECSGYSGRITRDADGRPCLIVSTPTGFLLPGTYCIVYSGQCSYTVTDQTETESGYTEAVLPLLCAHWDVPISNISCSVALPSVPDTCDVSLLSGYYGELAGEGVSITQNGSELSCTYTGSLLDHEALQLSLLLPEKYFSGASGISGISGGTSVGKFLLPLLWLVSVLYWYLKLKNRRLRLSRRMLPPSGLCAGDIPFLLFAEEPVPVCTLLQWADLGYLTLFRDSSGTPQLRRNMNMGNERKRQEQHLFYALFRSSDLCTPAGAAFDRLCSASGTRSAKQWNRRIFDRTGGSPALLWLLSALAMAVACWLAATALQWAVVLRILFAVAGFVLSFVIVNGTICLRRRAAVGDCIAAIVSLCILLLLAHAAGTRLGMILTCALSVFSGYVTAYGKRRTETGCELLEQLLSFRRFAASPTDEECTRLLHDDPQYFYRLLPFAAALHCGKAFSAAFGAKKPEPCGWYRRSGKPIRTASEFYAEICSFFGGLD